MGGVELICIERETYCYITLILSLNILLFTHFTVKRLIGICNKVRGQIVLGWQYLLI